MKPSRPLSPLPSRFTLRTASSIAALVLGTLCTQAATAGVSVLQPAKRVDATKPLTLTLLFGDDDAADNYRIPDTLKVSASADMAAPVQMILQRQGSGPSEVALAKGQYRKVSYSGVVPASLRGIVRIEPIDYDASAVMVSLVRPDSKLGPLPESPPAAEGGASPTKVAASSSSITAGTSAPVVDAPPAAIDLINASRLSLNEPTYFVGGNSGRDANAKFQISFKYRIFEPNDPRSRGVIDNLYFAYTQFSIWDLQAPSSPFRDTNYRPSLYYFLPDLGLTQPGSFISRTSVATGLEHESNGQDGAKSRGINIAFVQPSVSFGNLNDYHLTVAPKIYTYLGPLRDNPDIADYRGHVDLRLSFGKPDGIEFSTMLRKGKNSNAGSADNQLSYPLARLIPGTAGYIMASYYYGYGESLLNYNQKLVPQFRVGFALSRW